VRSRVGGLLQHDEIAPSFKGNSVFPLQSNELCFVVSCGVVGVKTPPLPPNTKSRPSPFSSFHCTLFEGGHLYFQRSRLIFEVAVLGSYRMPGLHIESTSHSECTIADDIYIYIYPPFYFRKWSNVENSGIFLFVGQHP